jgi:hypothetical protein
MIGEGKKECRRGKIGMMGGLATVGNMEKKKEKAAEQVRIIRISLFAFNHLVQLKKEESTFLVRRE